MDEDLLPQDPRQWGGLQEAINMPVIRAVVLVETAWWKALQQYGQEVAHWTHRDEPPTMAWNKKVWHIRAREAAKFFRKNRGRADSRYTGCPPGSCPDLKAASAPQRKRAELEDAFEAYKQLHTAMPPAPAVAAGAATPQQRAAVTRSTMLLLRPKHRRGHGIVLWHIAKMKVLHAEATVRAVLPRVLAAAAQPMSIVVTTGAMTDAAVLGMPHVLPSGAAWLHIAPPTTNVQDSRAVARTTTSRSVLMHFTQALSHAFLMLWSQRLPWCACRACTPLSPPRRLMPPEPSSTLSPSKRQRIAERQ